MDFAFLIISKDPSIPIALLHKEFDKTSLITQPFPQPASINENGFVYDFKTKLKISFTASLCALAILSSFPE